MDRETGQSRGFGFVTIGNVSEGNAAIKGRQLNAGTPPLINPAFRWTSLEAKQKSGGIRFDKTFWPKIENQVRCLACRCFTATDV
jgi:hypothetical protein